eukprot:5302279-Amphidinium_carterae.1
MCQTIELDVDLRRWAWLNSWKKEAERLRRRASVSWTPLLCRSAAVRGESPIDVRCGVVSVSKGFAGGFAGRQSLRLYVSSRSIRQLLKRRSKTTSEDALRDLVLGQRLRRVKAVSACLWECQSNVFYPNE